MAFIQMALKDAVESEIVTEAEYDLRVVEAEVVPSKNPEKPGAENIKVVVAIESAEYPNAQPITHFLALPYKTDSSEALAMKLRMTRRFLAAFKVSFDDNGFDVDDLAGATGKSLVKKVENVDQKTNRPTGNFRNELALPKFSSEDVEDEPAPRGRAGASGGRRGK